MPNRSGSGPLPPPQMGEDLISGLPDDVLRAVLVRLGSARAAARTSVLSRRWCRVWVYMAEILLDIGVEARPPAPASFLDAVDGALAGCLAPALERLSIDMFDDPVIPVPAGRVAPWLRFAAERVSGELCLVMHPHPPPDTEEAELELAVCAGAKTIRLSLYSQWRLRLQPAGLFKALTALAISGKMEGSELTTLVCTRCPRLRSLDLSGRLVAVADVSILSDSLRSLSYRVRNTQRLQVVAARLEELTLSASTDDEASIVISAPKVGKLRWLGTYDPRYHRFSDVSRHLSLLVIDTLSLVASLTRQFDEVDVLNLLLFVTVEVGYQSFLDATKKMPKCKTLSVLLFWYHHGLAPVILHLFRSCNSMRKLSLSLHNCGALEHSCPSSCPFCTEDSRRIDNIDLSSLEEVEISSSKISYEELEFVEVLSRCSATILKKLVINYRARATPEAK
ncbi:unnamed protein product [Urochloa decumbens]|uniref:F-box/LRR-repeat protein 15/At3g58940/PEG3-like LRR domain-containing protein n=1 Tax=Urochloa decumbens TaxID=240449 RepID=A0ABC8WB99_9POAL